MSKPSDSNEVVDLLDSDVCSQELQPSPPVRPNPSSTLSDGVEPLEDTEDLAIELVRLFKYLQGNPQDPGEQVDDDRIERIDAAVAALGPEQLAKYLRPPRR